MNSSRRGSDHASWLAVLGYDADPDFAIAVSKRSDTAPNARVQTGEVFIGIAFESNVKSCHVSQ
jgi:hypothetical protein